MLRTLPAPIVGALWMVASMAFFSIQNVLVRVLADDFHTLLLLFFRALVGLFLITPWLLRAGAKGFATRKLPLYGIRALLTYGGAALWFYALSVFPLADAVALHFSVPLFGLILAVLILKETVNGARLWATLFGFAGIVVILRPGFTVFDPLGLLVLASAALYGGVSICVKLLTRTEPPVLIVFYMN
ncbi:MAG: DMT family transporter, partial [Alphaproteobacteria bacterium]